MDTLQVAWEKLKGAFKEHGTLNTVDMCRSIRTYLQRVPSVDQNIEQQQCVAWCEQVFASALPLDDVLLLTWQVLYRGSPFLASHLADDNRVYMRLGRVRAKLIYNLFQADQELEAVAQYLGQLVRIGGVDALLATTILEIAEKLVVAFPDNIGAMIGPLLFVLQELILYKDELVLHKIRALVLALYRSRPLEDSSRRRLDCIVWGIEKDVKMRYLLLKDLLEAGIEVAGLTDLTTLTPLLKIIVENKAIAPAVSDCVVLFIKIKGLSMKVISDPLGIMGSLLYPRMVRRLERAQVFGLLESMRIQSVPGDEDVLNHYFSLYVAILGGEIGRPVLDSRLVEASLGAHSELLRIRAFSCLCRSVTMDSPFDSKLKDLVGGFIFESQLGVGPDARQQIVAILKHLVEIHFSRLYKLLRETRETSDAISDPFMKAHQDEVQAIIGMWSQIVMLCMSSLSKDGFFNKNDLSLKILLGIVLTWRERLQKCLPVKSLHGSLDLFYSQIVETLREPVFVECICQCVVYNSFDTVREGAASLLRALQYPSSCPFVAKNVDTSYLVQEIIPLLASKRAHLLDGATKLLGLYCDAHRNHAVVVRTIAQLLDRSARALDPGNAASYSQSKALGLLIALRRVIDQANVSDVELVAESCVLVGKAVNEYISLASPEGHQVAIGQEGPDDDDEEDCDDLVDQSFAVMTFCWRASKEFSALLAACWKRQDAHPDPGVLQRHCRFLTATLLSARHPGAFVALSRSLREICHLCYASTSEGLAMLPKNLLAETLRSCKDKPEEQTTRRSAGIPYCIAAIISGSSSPVQRDALLKDTINFLLKVVSDGASFSALTPRPNVVHTLNVLRLLYRESCLAEVVIPHLSSGFALCFRAFGSPNWSVRNSGLMLFTALMNRTFGVRHEAEDFAAPNLVDVRMLHAKGAEILSVIGSQCLDSLRMLRKTDLGDNRYQIEFSVYPLLSFIQRVRFSLGGEQRHVEFYKMALEYVWQCLGNDIIKVRHMSARLLCHMCESQVLLGCLKARLECVSTDDVTCSRANWIHGLAFLLKLLSQRRLVSELDLVPLETRLLSLQASQCYPIRSLLEKGSDAVNENAPLDYSLEEMTSLLKLRTLSAPMISTIMVSMVDYALTQDDEFADSLFGIFESFWTDYDLAGLYRTNLVKAWRWTNRSEHPAAIRIHYLALTDEDEDLREIASGPCFTSTPGCVARVLGRLLKSHTALIADLLTYMPTSSPDILDSGRKALFEAEPLNCFKDPDWEARAVGPL